jgi:hypothetical protein
VDSEGGSIDLESLLSQLMEFLLTIIGNRRYQGTVKASMGELQYVTLGEPPAGWPASRSACLPAGRPTCLPPCLPSHLLACRGPPQHTRRGVDSAEGWLGDRLSRVDWWVMYVCV